MNPKDIALRVGFYGMGEFCHELFNWLGAGWPEALTEPSERFVLASPIRHIALTLYRVSPIEKVHHWDDIAVGQVTFETPAAMPFQLSLQTETPDSARAKLSNDTFASQNRVSYFMEEQLVVALHFKPNMVGFDRVLVARLGTVADWRSR